MRAHLVIFLLFSSFALAATTFSTNQKTNLEFVFRSANTSSVFVYFPQGWGSLKSSAEFSCPADWFKDADFQDKVHCACAAPCRSFLSEGNLSIRTQAPNVSGNYSWNILAYDEKGKLVYNGSPTMLVQTPPSLVLQVKAMPVLVQDNRIFLEAMVENKGQATLKALNFSLKVYTPQGDDVSSQYAFFAPQNLLLKGGERFAFNATLSSLSASLGPRLVALTGAGVDENSQNTVQGSAELFTEVRKPALVSVVSVIAPPKVSAGQRFNVSVLLKNTGGVAARAVNVSFSAEKNGTRKYLGSSPVGTLFPESLGGAATVTSTLFEAETYILLPTMSFVEEYSNAYKENTPLSMSGLTPPIIVQKPSALVLNSTPRLETFTSENFSVATEVRNEGQASSLNTQTHSAKTTGGCQVVGVSERPLGVFELNRSSTQDWVFVASEEGGRCRLFFEATGLDENSGEVVSSLVAITEVIVNAREKASFEKIGVTFFQKEGQWYVVKPLSEKDWDVSVGSNSELKLLVEKIAKKQYALEARLRSMQLRLEATANELPAGSKSVHSEVTVDLAKPPSTEASVDLRILSPTSENIPSLSQLSGVMLKKPLAVVRVDKRYLENKDEIQSASLIISVEKTVVDENGGVENIRVLREDKGDYTFLPTRLINQSATRYTFEAFSQEGLSLFAMYAVEQIVPEEKPSAATGEVVLSQFYQKGYGAIALVILLVAAFVLIRLKNQPPKHRGYFSEEPRHAKPQPLWEQHKLEKDKRFPQKV